MMGIRWYVWTFILFLASIIIIANFGLVPKWFPFLKLIPWSDKFGHFFLMGGLSFLLNLSFSAQRMSVFSTAIPKGTVIAFLIVTLEELSQLFIRSRNFELADLFFDMAGILTFGMLATVVVARRQSSQRIAS